MENWIQCPFCCGRGYEPGWVQDRETGYYDDIKCKDCDGTGEIQEWADELKQPQTP